MVVWLPGIDVTSPSLSYGVIKEIKLQILQSQTLRILIIFDMFLFQKI